MRKPSAGKAVSGVRVKSNSIMTAWLIAQFGIVMFLVGYFHGRNEEMKANEKEKTTCMIVTR